jgi:hypothetical protein
MNKNSAKNRRLAAKNYRKGNNPSQFEIKKTMPGSALGSRVHTITVGFQPRKSTYPKVAAKRGSIAVKNGD